MSETHYQYKTSSIPEVLLFIGAQRVRRWSVIDVVYRNEIPMSCNVNIDVVFSKALWNILGLIDRQRKPVYINVVDTATGNKIHAGMFLLQGAHAYPESKRITVTMIATGEVRSSVHAQQTTEQ